MGYCKGIGQGIDEGDDDVVVIDLEMLCWIGVVFCG